jgi:ice-binding like protein/PEP-CTERM motif-containing protein
MKHKYSALLAVLAFGSFTTEARAVSLASAGSFGLLGGSGVTNTGNSVVNNGNVGSAPTPAVTGFPPGVVNGGTLFTLADPVTAQAHADLQTAYTAAQTAPGGVPGPADLGGATLTPGVYTYVTTAAWTAGTLTLNGAGEYIFQIGTAITTPANAVVSLINGASADQVFWQLGTAATLGAANDFAGNILAGSSITLGGGTLNGRALALVGAVTISTAETVNVPAAIPEPSTSLLLGSGLLGLAASRKRRIS